MKILRARRQAGFTLVEAVMVIVIVGILAGIVAVFIRAPVLGYRDSVDRAEITDQADLALRRMARDVRLALPNSVRVSADGSAVELLQTRSGARYLDSDDGLAGAAVLSFDDPAQAVFTALAPPPSFSRVRKGDFVVVYNLGEGMGSANAYQLAATGVGACPTGGAASAAGNIACINADPASTTVAVNGVNVPAMRITLAGNPFAYQDVALPSPQKRFQVVSGPVSLYCQARADGTLDLWRAWGYAIAAAQPVPPSDGQRALVATRLTRCGGLFSYSTAAAQRTGLLGINLELRGRYDSAPAIRLVHQVHVDNTP